MKPVPVLLTPDQWLTDRVFQVSDLNDLFIRWHKANAGLRWPLRLTLGRAEEEQMMSWAWSITYTRTAFDGMTPKQAEAKVRRDSSDHWQREWKRGWRVLPGHFGSVSARFRIELLDVESHCELR